MSAVYPSVDEMLVCFYCMQSFRVVYVYALQCHHLICAHCGSVQQNQDSGMCAKCRTPQYIDQNFTNYIFSCRETDPTPNYQTIRQSLDFVFVPCRNEACPKQTCPFDHSEYAKGLTATLATVEKLQIKVCRRCKVRGSINATKCVRCNGPLATDQMNKVARFPNEMQLSFSYFGNKKT